MTFLYAETWHDIEAPEADSARPGGAGEDRQVWTGDENVDQRDGRGDGKVEQCR